MRPSRRHRFLSVPTGIRLNLSWPPPPPLRRRLRHVFTDRPRPSDPADVDPAEFRHAFTLLHEDPAAAAEAFRILGYQVTVQSREPLPGNR